MGVLHCYRDSSMPISILNIKMRALWALTARNLPRRLLTKVTQHNSLGLPPRCFYARDKAESDEPVKYSRSAAADFSTVADMEEEFGDAPWYQPPSVLISLICFGLYFCVFREENDLDHLIASPPASLQSGDGQYVKLK